MKATSFKFDEKTTELLDHLKDDTHASSRSEVIRKALKLLKVASDADHDKKEIVIKDRDGNEQRIILW
ncbi:ribbon-helix-helix protein, CopG family [Vibrio anguillarum]|uniref:Ribbon-helix-helix protein, CopG family n=2 Tax=Vibrio anguillarum TaxID=55601 RepID=A0AAW4BJX5_VIBAN|nr:ribbon-helix-helix protein, CopG family [Vibrio anguillarum]EHU9446955.1 ribbon-helix-helix protein, CopG family [Vibrio vulnificus]EJT3522308.1 ribbon-helix-helix protein, CopG family [Vibrio parahaemolyticus]MBF4228021.1 ribbon-helix-helix protein, CopG family [Vibrio anguillarum]MBF4247284.1 ribbon-helix-helix protein, CopG family [Vibrio anguillarum]MBF4375417.1 ribbon-helix-helix protein, CopG family [Vibrio anguillarum]